MRALARTMCSLGRNAEPSLQTVAALLARPGVAHAFEGWTEDELLNLLWLFTGLLYMHHEQLEFYYDPDVCDGNWFKIQKKIRFLSGGRAGMLFTLDEGWVHGLQMSVAGGGNYLIRGMCSLFSRHLGLAESCQVPQASLHPPSPLPP